MARLDLNRQNELEHKRMSFAINSVTYLGYEITTKTSTYFEFEFKDEIVRFFPYSGWHSGKSITDGRGIALLLKQIKR